MEVAVSQLSKGMNKDLPVEYTSEGNHLFALNAIDESEEGDVGVLSNENSNAPVLNIPDRIIIGKQVLDSNSLCLFLVSKDESISEIAIYNVKDNTYTVEVSDIQSVNKLNFKLHHWVDTTYRIRRGCLRTVYFTDGYNKPRRYCFDTPDYFKTNGLFDADKCNFNRDISKIPTLDIDVKQGGSLKAGQYFVAIQYSNKEFAETDWITISNGVIIYNSSLNNSLQDISGDIWSVEESYLSTPELSNKSIEVKVSNIDKSFDFYKLAFICCNTNSSDVSEVLSTDIISTSTDTFIFNGSNYHEKLLTEDIIVDSLDIKNALTIDQHLNRLVLGNIQEVDYDYSEFQKAASLIKTSCITKDISLTSKSKEHPTDPLHKFNGGVGYMPGEIYSFGIVYVFKNGKKSPVFHIPGTSGNYPSPSYGKKMSIDNEMAYSYTSTNDDYWGVDGSGESLINKKVRHHRFPTRRELGVKTANIDYKDSSSATSVRYNPELKITIDTTIPEYKKALNTGNIDIHFRHKPPYNDQYGDISIVENLPIIDGDNWITLSSRVPITSSSASTLSSIYEVGVKHEFEVVETIHNDDGTETQSTYKEYRFTSDLSILKQYGIKSYEWNVVEDTRTNLDSTNIEASSTILGIHFYDIKKPNIPNKEDIIGYFFVRNERKEEDKTIIDSCVLLPTLKDKEDKYTGFGLVLPEFEDDKAKQDKSTYVVVGLEYTFNNSIYNFTDIDIVGTYSLIPDGRKYGLISQENVLEGSTFVSGTHAGGDSDGWDLKVFSRSNYTVYDNNPTIKTISKDDIDFYSSLGAFDNIEYKGRNIFNLTTDNKAFVIKLKAEEQLLPSNTSIPYCVLRSNHKTSYSNFLNSPYYQISSGIYDFSNNSAVEFNGDTYVGSISYNTHVLYDVRPQARNVKHPSIWKTVGSALAIVAGIAAAFILPGLGALVGGPLIALGGAALLLSSELKVDNLSKILQEEYEKGLREAIIDRFTWYFLTGDTGYGMLTGGEFNPNWQYVKKYYNAGDPKNNPNPEARCIHGANVHSATRRHAQFAGQDGFDDDNIIWIADCLPNLFFDSTINTYLRCKPYVDIPSYIHSNISLESSNNETLTFYASDAGKGNDRDYIHSVDRPAIGTFNKLSSSKLLRFNTEEKKYDYRGVALSDYWMLNKSYGDVHIKPYFALDITKHQNTDCDNCFPHRILWSNISREEEYEDNFVKFLANNYKDITSSTGKITHILSLQDGIYIHTEYAFFKQPLNYQERVNDSFTSYIGTGEFASLPEQRFITSSTGLSAGLAHIVSSCNTSSGYYFIGNEEGRIYKFSGALEIISNNGMYKWLSNNLKVTSTLNSNVPWCENGNGIIIEEDTYLNRVLVTKKEFFSNEYEYYGGYLFSKDSINSIIREGYVFDRYDLPRKIYKKGSNYYGIVGKKEELKSKNFTLSYSNKSNSWVSFHSYLPNNYISLGKKLLSYSANSSNLLLHNIENSYQVFDNQYYPFVLEFANTKSPINTFTTECISFLTEATKHTSNGSFEEKWITFNKALFYNTRQCSGYINLKPKDKDMGKFYMVQQVVLSEYNIDRNERDWTANYLRDNRVEYEAPMFEEADTIIYSDKVLNITTNQSKSWTEKELFRDKYLVCRFILDNEEQVKLKYKYMLHIKDNSVR